MTPAHASDPSDFLRSLLLFLGAAVVAVPLFRRLGLGAIIGYLAAGLAIGPSGLRLFTDVGTIDAVGELGVVLLLFVIGLELQPSRLLAMRRDIFGLGGAQLVACALAFGLVALAFGLPVSGAVVTGLALALSATSIALSQLEERGELQTAYGQRSFAVLLFQDLSVVPILALVPLLAMRAGPSAMDRLQAAALSVGAVAAVVGVGRYALNPLFRVLAASGAREVMTAAALLLVLGTALLMRSVGLSMALGAFLAGVLLAESRFRHELEADIEPFRGLLLGLFFISVGMGVDGRLVGRHAVLLLALAVGLAAAKTGLVAGLFRLGGSTLPDAVRAGALLSPAGEFAFVLLPLGAANGLMDHDSASLLSALAAVGMLLGPPLVAGCDGLLARLQPPAGIEEDFAEAGGAVLVIGFGRFGQVLVQVLRSAGIPITIIDADVEMIDVAQRFGTRVYFGDGARLDVLRAAGASQARLIVVAIDNRAAAVRIVEMARAEFPLARVVVRAYDRQHALALLEAGADAMVRETYESAMLSGRMVLEALDIDEAEIGEVMADVRERDAARLRAQQQGGIYAGVDLVRAGASCDPSPCPTLPRARAGRAGRIDLAGDAPGPRVVRTDAGDLLAPAAASSRPSADPPPPP